MPIRSFTWNDLPALLDLVERIKSWQGEGRELGRQNFREILGQPGLDPEVNCLLLEDRGQLQEYCLAFPELPVGRAVLELEAGPHLAGGPLESQLLRRAVERARGLGAKVAHLCLPQGSPRHKLLEEQGFSLARTYWEMGWQQELVPPLTLPEGFAIRHFKPGDTLTLTEVQNTAFGGGWGFCPNTVEQIRYRSSMSNTSHQGILFLCHGDRVAGYCWTCVTPGDGQNRGVIGMLGVVPDYRGRRVSQPILLAGMQYLWSIGVHDIGLNVDESNRAAIRLYRSMGFKKAEELNWFELDLLADQPRQ